MSLEYCIASRFEKYSKRGATKGITSVSADKFGLIYTTFHIS